MLLAACRSDPPSAPPAAPSTSPPAAAAAPAPAARLSTATIADPKTFNPIVATDAASLAAVGDVFESLVRLDPRTAAMTPALAERWQLDADGALTLVLRPGVRWHDGQPLTATDVVFTFDAIYDPSVPSPLKAMLTVDGRRLAVEALDERTVRIRPPRPYAPLLSAIAVPVVPRHVLGAALAAGDLARRWGIETPPAELIGTGPYRLAAYAPGEAIHLTRNPDYWMRDEAGQPLPYLAEQTIHILPDPDAAYAAFLAGGTDIHTLRPDEARELVGTTPARPDVVVRQLGVDPGMLFVTFNRNPAHQRRGGGRDPHLAWFTDPRFLRALAHGIDKRAIIAEALHGFGQPAVSFVSPAVPQFHNPTLADYAFDPSRARALLAEGGYVDRDGDGTVEDRDGHPVEFTLHTNAGNRAREAICAHLEREWDRGLGIRARCTPLDFALLVEKLDITFDWDAMLMGLSGSLEPHGAAPLLRSGGAMHVWHPNQPTPASEWEAEIDRLLDAGTRTAVPDERRRIYWRIQEIVNEQLPMIQLVHPLRFVAAAAAIENYEPTVWGVYRPERIRFGANGRP